MQIEIKSWLTGSVLFSGEYENIREALEAGVKSRANLSRANLYSANLSGGNLSGANLSRAYLSSADMSGANLSGADLFGADMSDANLSGADMSGANLSGANLSRAYLSSADLSRADMSGANLDSKHCFISISPIGSENGCLWVMADDKGVLKYNRGCFSGTEKEFMFAVNEKHGGTDQEKKYLAAVEFIKLQLGDRIKNDTKK